MNANTPPTPEDRVADAVAELLEALGAAIVRSIEITVLENSYRSETPQKENGG